MANESALSLFSSHGFCHRIRTFADLSFWLCWVKWWSCNNHYTLVWGKHDIGLTNCNRWITKLLKISKGSCRCSANSCQMTFQIVRIPNWNKVSLRIGDYWQDMSFCSLSVFHYSFEINQAKFIVVAILLLCYFTILVFSFVIYFFKFVIGNDLCLCVEWLFLYTKSLDCYLQKGCFYR